MFEIPLLTIWEQVCEKPMAVFLLPVAHESTGDISRWLLSDGVGDADWAGSATGDLALLPDRLLSAFSLFAVTSKNQIHFFLKFIILSVNFTICIGCMNSFPNCNLTYSSVPLKACLHLPSPSKFIIVSVPTDFLADRLGSEPTLFVSVNLTGTETVCVNGPSFYWHWFYIFYFEPSNFTSAFAPFLRFFFVFIWHVERSTM